MNESTDDRPTAAEARVAEYLASLRAAGAPEGDVSAAGLVRTVRWQRAVRQPLRLVGVLLGALGDGVGLLARSTRRSG
jgi:hypothetical protein